MRPVRGLTVKATARSLLAHDDGDYEEWGVGGNLQLDPGRIGRGLSLRLASGWGITDSRTDTLWQQQTASGLTQGAEQTPQSRFMAEWAYGLDCALEPWPADPLRRRRDGRRWWPHPAPGLALRTGAIVKPEPGRRTPRGAAHQPGTRPDAALSNENMMLKQG